MYKKSTEDKIEKGLKISILEFIIIVIFLSYTYKLFSMQIINGDKYKTQSKNISSQVKTIPAQRGEIFDRNATLPLVINTESFAVEITPGEIPKGKYDSVAQKLAFILGIKKEDIDKKVPASVRRSYATYQIKSNVPFTIITDIAENKSDLPGVSWYSKPIRNYVETGSLSHIIGYVGDISDDEVTMMYNRGYNKNSIIGKAGIEKQYDALLQGVPGRESKTVDVRGRILSDTPVITEPQMGKNLVLTIDTKIQKLAEEALGERVGSVVVLKPSTGEVLAMVSYPFFDSNIFNSDEGRQEYAKLLQDDTKPFLNRAVQTAYPPASTFKVIMSTAMLSEDAFPSDKKIECNGSLFYGGRTFHCHIRGNGHGPLDLKNGLAQSCNVYYWTIGRDYLQIDKIGQYAKMFGFGQSAEIDLPNQATGFVPTPEWKERRYHERWLGGDTMSVSIGQSYMEATPLQLADMVAMVSNKGTIYKPHLLKEVRDPVTNEVITEVEPEVLYQNDIKEEVWDEVQAAMRYTCTDGTPQYVMKNKVVQIACKTGTAEVAQYKESWHSWLVAYAPYDAPPEDRICIATIVEARNKWEWWAPYCTNIVIQGIFADQTFEEAVKELGFTYLPAIRGRQE